MAIDELAYVGYWFYEADQDQQDQASLFASYGLIENPPSPAPVTISLLKILGSDTKKIIG